MQTVLRNNISFSARNALAAACFGAAIFFGGTGSAYALAPDEYDPVIVEHIQSEFAEDGSTDITQYNLSYELGMEYVEYAVLRNVDFADITMIADGYGWNEAGERIATTFVGYSMYDDADRPGIVKAAQDAVEEVKTWMPPNADEITRARVIHDYVCTITEYDYMGYGAYTESIAHHGGSAFYFNKGVCDCYADAFTMLANEFDLEVKNVRNLVHEWNVIKIDGEWYNIDVCHDDTVDGLSGNFVFTNGIGKSHFLKTTSYIQNRCSSHTFEWQFPEKIFCTSDKYDDSDFMIYAGPYNNRSYYGAWDYFNDTKPGVWYVDSGVLDWAVNNQIIKGDNGYFYGDRDVTRAEMAAIIYRIFGNNGEAPISDSKDVDYNSWYGLAANWVINAGIIVGDGEYFRPNDPITREEMCVVLSRLIGFSNADSVDGFSDSDTVSGWAQGAVYGAIEAGIINGIDTGSERLISPQSGTTRAMAVTMLWNANILEYANE